MLGRYLFPFFAHGIFARGAELNVPKVKHNPQKIDFDLKQRRQAPMSSRQN